MKVHDVARFASGKHAGLAGVVLDVRPETKMVFVEVSGVVNGETVEFSRWFKESTFEGGANGES